MYRENVRCDPVSDNLYRQPPLAWLATVSVSWYSGGLACSAETDTHGSGKCQTSLTWLLTSWGWPESGYSSQMVNTQARGMNRLLVLTTVLLGKS